MWANNESLRATLAGKLLEARLDDEASSRSDSEDDTATDFCVLLTVCELPAAVEERFGAMDERRPRTQFRFSAACWLRSRLFKLECVIPVVFCVHWLCFVAYSMCAAAKLCDLSLTSPKFSETCQSARCRECCSKPWVMRRFRCEFTPRGR